MYSNNNLNYNYFNKTYVTLNKKPTKCNSQLTSYYNICTVLKGTETIIFPTLLSLLYYIIVKTFNF